MHKSSIMLVSGMAPYPTFIPFAHNYIRIIFASNVWERPTLASSAMRTAPLQSPPPPPTDRLGAGRSTCKLTSWPPSSSARGRLAAARPLSRTTYLAGSFVCFYCATFADYVFKQKVNVCYFRRCGNCFFVHSSSLSTGLSHIAK